ncbi:MAG TPA: hypothetical protein VK791_09850 [bacterium]|nr:hypothetical protein [bacterium]
MKKLISLMFFLIIVSLIPMESIASESNFLELNEPSQFKNTSLLLNAEELGRQQYEKIYSISEKPSADVCTGQVPESFLKPGQNTQSIFFKRFSKQDTLEATVLKTGESIVINSHACDYYSISFRIAFKDLPSSLSNTTFWFEKTAQALRDLNGISRGRSEFDLLSMAKRLDAEILKKKSFRDFPMVLHGDEDFKIVFEFLRVGYLPDKNGSFVEFAFYEGPL